MHSLQLPNTLSSEHGSFSSSQPEYKFFEGRSHINSALYLLQYLFIEILANYKDLI